MDDRNIKGGTNGNKYLNNVKINFLKINLLK